MQWNEEAEEIMRERFGGDNEMALATCRGSVPSVRTVNATYWEGCFYVITYGLSRKMEEIRDTPTVALSGDWFTCHGEAASLGWFGREENKALAAHLRTHKDYDIIHYHTASKIGAPVCGMMRVLCPRAKIVVHSHIVYPPMTLTWRAAHLVYQLFADYFLGCGVAAGRFVFGDHIDAKPNFSVACNAVDAGRFHPDAAARAATRAAWGITDTDRLAGFVGRLNHQKNPLFLMEVFAAMAAQDPHWKLLLVGTGEMEPEMRAAAARRGLTDRVIFAGVQSDVPAFMNAFDLFLLPSNFEGSPVTLVEAQGCGVPCLASTNVPDDGSVTDLVHFLPLAAPLTDWAAKAEAIAAHGDHDDHWAALSAAGYELKTAARRMEQLYDKLGGHA